MLRFQAVLGLIAMGLVSAPAFAQHYHGHAQGGHAHSHAGGHAHTYQHGGHLDAYQHGGHVDAVRHGGHTHTTYHSGSNWGHSDWSYVVPAHNHYGHGHHGSFYTTGHTHFYTPTAVAYASGPNYVAAPVQAPTQMAFGSFAYCDDLAGRLETDLNNFCLDLYHNYQQNPGYRETYREAYELLQQAKYIHAKEHQNNRQEIAQQVTSLDQKFHHIQEDVAAFGRNPARQVGIGGVVTKGQSIEALIHHLAYDVGVEPHAEQANPQIAPPPVGGSSGPITAPPPSSAPRVSLSSQPPTNLP